MKAFQQAEYLWPHSSVRLLPTKAFIVWEISQQPGVAAFPSDPKADSNHVRTIGRNLESYAVRNESPLLKHTKFIRNMLRCGCCVWRDLVDDDTRQKTREVLLPIVQYLISTYDVVDDSFPGVDQEFMNIVRMPRIGRGKHNIHFDPLESPAHEALAELAKESHFAEALTEYMKQCCTSYMSNDNKDVKCEVKCVLRETGISLTRPYNENMHQYSVHTTAVSTAVTANEEDIDVAAGEGMEWHSDGSKGEATVLMALEDVTPQQGSLRVIPNSHSVYELGVGHREESLLQNALLLEEECVVYNYRAGQPMMIDARTLHSVTPNVSQDWRWITWFIFDSY